MLKRFLLKLKSVFSRGRLWALLFVSNVLCLIILVVLYARLNEERAAAVARGDIFALGYQLGSYSDYLTMQAQSFAVTGDIEHFINYWKEIEVDKNREKVIGRLKEFGVADRESYLLIESKRQSDELVKTEMRSMLLVLQAYNISEKIYPKPLRNFHLEPDDQALSPEQKVATAQYIMFKEEYRKNKAKIMQPINQFNDKIAKNIQESILNKRQTTNWVIFILVMLFALNSLIVVGIIWVRQIPQSSPDPLPPKSE